MTAATDQSRLVGLESGPAHLELVGVSKHFGSFVAVDGVSFSMRRGERLALVGPSGCGKTTLLGIIGGFVEETAGSVLIAGRDITAVPAHKRNIGVVFQNYALFPHLTVEQNIYFGLKMRRMAWRDAEPTVRHALELVRLEPYRSRFPHQLSGGQQQRAAIARAIAIRPEILLLDEPLSNLDAKLRESMRTDMLEILDELSITTILVTHDQAEALALSDRVAVIDRGRIHQIARPKEAYENPATAFVANFLGQSNRLTGQVVEDEGGGLAVAVGSQRLRSTRIHPALRPGAAAAVFIRAERLRPRTGAVRFDNEIDGVLKLVIYLGAEQRLVVTTPLGDLTAAQPSDRDLPQASQPLPVGCGAEDVLVFPAE